MTAFSSLRRAYYMYFNYKLEAKESLSIIPKELRGDFYYLC